MSIAGRLAEIDLEHQFNVHNGSDSMPMKDCLFCYIFNAAKAYRAVAINCMIECRKFDIQWSEELTDKHAEWQLRIKAESELARNVK